jgi:surface protein
MATLSDLDLKRVELNSAIDDYKQAVVDFAAAAITQQDLDDAKELAILTGDEYAVLIAQVKKDDPVVTNDDQLFSNPGRMNALVRDDIAVIMTTGSFFGAGMKLLVDTEGNLEGATHVILPFDVGSDVTVDWGDGSARVTYSGSASHDYGAPGQYEVIVIGLVNGFTAPLVNSRRQIKDVMQWGTVEFQSTTFMFRDRAGFVISASDSPRFLPNASAAAMFENAADFNSNVSHWDMSNVVSIRRCFKGNSVFNQPLDNWDVSGVVNMEDTFKSAFAFDQYIGNWNVSNVATMKSMFYDAETYRKDMSKWDVSSVVDMGAMFRFAESFNENISGWDVSNVLYYSQFAEGTPIFESNKPNFV